MSAGHLREGGSDALIDDPEFVRAMREAWLAQGLVGGEHELARPDGASVIIEFTSGLLPADPGEGQIGYVILRDVTAARRATREAARAAEQQALFASASRAFAEAGTDVSTVLNELARRVDDSVGDTCSVRLTSDDGGALELTAVHSREPAVVEAIVALDAAHPLRADGDTPLARVMRNGQGLLVPTVDPELMLAGAPPEYRELLRRFPLRSVLIAPLRAQGRCLGALTVSRFLGERPPLVAGDLAVVMELADRAALTVYNARLLAFAASELDERRRLERERERLAAVIEQATEMVMVTDKFGDIEYVNPAFEAATGFTRAEIQGKNPRILRSGAQSPDLYRNLWATIGAGKTWRGRLVNRKKDGSYYTEDAIIAPVRDADGLTSGYFALKRDISRDLSLEAQLLQAQKMEGIGRLAGGVAHDFNNILSVILGSVRFALEELRQDNPVREELLEIERAGERAAVLTRQLLAFGSRQLLKAEPIDLNRVIAEMRRMLERILGEDVELVEEPSPTLGVVKADAGQVEQVIMNLVINARDAMPSGGRLTIRTEDVDIDPEFAAAHGDLNPGPHVRISVTDTGIGMDAKTLRRIFEPFFTTKEPGKGTGLGLSTVYGIVAQSGGRVHVYSELGQGTTVNVYLPRIEAAVVERQAKAAPAVARGVETVLVLEDDEPVRRVVRRVLEGAGYRVLAAANGEEGLALYQRHAGEIQLVLSDVVMPVMSGPEFVEHARRSRPDLRVLFMSGYTDDAMLRQGRLEGEVDLVTKPLSHVDLLRRVREALDRPAPRPTQ